MKHFCCKDCEYGYETVHRVSCPVVDIGDTRVSRSSSVVTSSALPRIMQADISRNQSALSSRTRNILPSIIQTTNYRVEASLTHRNDTVTRLILPSVTTSSSIQQQQSEGVTHATRVTLPSITRRASRIHQPQIVQNIRQRLPPLQSSSSSPPAERPWSELLPMNCEEEVKYSLIFVEAMELVGEWKADEALPLFDRIVVEVPDILGEDHMLIKHAKQSLNDLRENI